MDAFTTHTGTAAPLRRSAVDTDQIIPAEYLKRITRTGFEDGLFVAWRKNEPDFVLNQPQYAAASVLVAGPDFGTGSSREHAVWALEDYGFRAIVAPSFADIFRSNCYKVGLLPVEVSPEVGDRLMAAVEVDPAVSVTVDLETCRLTVPTAHIDVSFPIDEYTRWRLREGLDDIALTLRHQEQITEYELRRQATLGIARAG